ncbi:MAG: hypothetical protein M5U09_27955 [Gammaproteobacteria bacterium]|nr:hypothetical protein [Gammaproteobacteria bacterium]
MNTNAMDGANELKLVLLTTSVEYSFQTVMVAIITMNQATTRPVSAPRGESVSHAASSPDINLE